MAVDTSKAIHKPAPKMSKQELAKMAQDLGKLKYNKKSVPEKKSASKKKK